MEYSDPTMTDLKNKRSDTKRFSTTNHTPPSPS